MLNKSINIILVLILFVKQTKVYCKGIIKMPKNTLDKNDGWLKEYRPNFQNIDPLTFRADRKNNLYQGLFFSFFITNLTWLKFFINSKNIKKKQKSRVFEFG